MSISAPTGYAAGKYAMPIIQPPASGTTTPASHYASVLSGLSGWSVTQVANEALRMSFTGPAHQLYAMSGGEAWFVPAGQPLPTAGQEASPGGGTIVLKTWAVDFTDLKKKLPPNVSPPTKVLYLNVRESTFEAEVTTRLQNATQGEIDAGWKASNTKPPSSRAAAETFLLGEIMAGRWKIWVEAGAFLGSAELADTNDALSPTQLDIRFVASDDTDMSPMLQLRSMPSWAGPDWTGHPLVEGSSGFPLTLNAHVAFEVYNLTSKAFDRLPQNVAVDLMDFDPIFGDDLLATAQTDANGVAHFAGVPDIEGSDIYFLAKPGAGMTHAGHTLPAQWSTKGWLGADGFTKGYYENFIGNELGEAATPLVFRIGIDFHGRLEYDDVGATPRQAISGVPFGIFATGLGQPEAMLLTEPNGEVHGVTFAIAAEQSIAWGVDFTTEDGPAPISRTTAPPPPIGSFGRHNFDSGFSGPYNKVHANNAGTSLGADAAPVAYRFKSHLHDVGLFFLKTRRELEVFLDTISGGTWPGIADLNYDYSAIAGVPYSWPVGEVNMNQGYYWQRDTLMHETGHQVMWKEANYTTWSIGLSAIQIHQRLYLTHSENLLANEAHALIEGWAEYVGWLFERNSPYPLGTIDDGSASGTTLDSSPNLGESVEAAFANALWQITRDLVIAPLPIPAGSAVPEAWDGDVKVTAPWITDAGAQQRWRSMILEPLQAMSTPPKTTTHFVDEMRSRNGADWHKIRKRLQDWNLAIKKPTVTSVNPNTGPQGGGTAITIAGDDFVEGCDVEIGGNAATAVVVVNSTTITAVTPVGGVGAFDLEVITRPALSALSQTGLLAGGFTYA